MYYLNLKKMKKDILKCEDVIKEEEPEDIKLTLWILLEKSELFSLDELKYAFNNMEAYYKFDRYYKWDAISFVYRMKNFMQYMKNHHIERRVI